MCKNRLFILLCLICSQVVFSAPPSNDNFETRPPFSANELHIIEHHLLSNICTQDRPLIKKGKRNKLMQSLPGAVLASPSALGPFFSLDYQIHWVRDAAIAMQEVLYLYVHSTQANKKKLRPFLMDYIAFEKKLQQMGQHVGGLLLGEPKFNIDGTLWDQKWARPQNDGPALRALTMIGIANALLEEIGPSEVEMLLGTMIATDLRYIVAHWQDASFDIWEELSARDHFFNKMVQRKALLIGARLFKQWGHEEQAQGYQRVAKELAQSLRKHWDPSRGYFIETLNQQYHKGGGLNSSVLLGLLYGNLDDEKDEFALNNIKAINSIYFIHKLFSSLYKINLYYPDRAPLLGRYPNDIYDGNHFKYGNPWILTTNALAQYYYALARIYLKQGEILITKDTDFFFRELDPSLPHLQKTLAIKKDDVSFQRIIKKLIAAGDKLLETVKCYSTCYSSNNKLDCYHLSEQIDRASGKPSSAKDLTWSYATLLMAMQQRASISQNKSAS